MAEKVLQLHPSRGFFLSGGLHLVNPEKPYVVLPEHYQPDAIVTNAIKSGILRDVNQNILTDGKAAAGPKVEAPADEPVADEEPKAKGKKTTK